MIVLPSYREGLSRVLIEAASASKPIIASNVPGCNDVVADGVNGYLCSVKNSQALAESIEKMIVASDIEFKHFSNNSLKIAKEKFDRSIVNKIYLDSIKKVLGWYI